MHIQSASFDRGYLCKFWYPYVSWCRRKLCWIKMYDERKKTRTVCKTSGLATSVDQTCNKTTRQPQHKATLRRKFWIPWTKENVFATKVFFNHKVYKYIQGCSRTGHPAYRKRLENYMTELFCSTIYWTHILIFFLLSISSHCVNSVMEFSRCFSETQYPSFWANSIVLCRTWKEKKNEHVSVRTA